MEAFLHIYTATMKRNNADSEYFFKQDYFYAIKNKLSENALFIFIYKEGLVISVELVILNKYIAYSFLGGTLKEYFKFRPNDYLKHILIKTLKQRGLSFFMLGGGESLDDGIFKYKRNFSKNGVCNFYIGKLIHDETLYAEADSTIMMVQDLIADIKARPKRYFHITLF